MRFIVFIILSVTFTACLTSFDEISDSTQFSTPLDSISKIVTYNTISNEINLIEEFFYDELNRRKVVYRNDGTATYYQYIGNTNMIASTHTQNYQYTNFTYDNQFRLIKVESNGFLQRNYYLGSLVNYIIVEKWSDNHILKYNYNSGLLNSIIKKKIYFDEQGDYREDYWAPTYIYNYNIAKISGKDKVTRITMYSTSNPNLLLNLETYSYDAKGKIDFIDSKSISAPTKRKQYYYY